MIKTYEIKLYDKDRKHTMTVYANDFNGEFLFGTARVRCLKEKKTCQM